MYILSKNKLIDYYNELFIEFNFSNVHLVFIQICISHNFLDNLTLNSGLF